MVAGDSLVEGEDVLVRGRVEKVYPKHGLVEVTFAHWWPRWSAILVKREQIAPLPAGLTTTPEP